MRYAEQKTIKMEIESLKSNKQIKIENYTFKNKLKMKNLTTIVNLDRH